MSMVQAPDPSPVAPTFPLLGEPLAIDLANTVIASDGGYVDLLSTPAQLRAWIAVQGARLRGASATGPLPRLDDIHELREALRVLFRAAMAGEQPALPALAVVNGASMAVPSAPQLEWDVEVGPQARSSEGAADPARAVLAAIARSGIDILGGDSRKRLRACSGPGCVLLFVADNARRQWCSPSQCGNRVRVARHYRRRHSSRQP